MTQALRFDLAARRLCEVESQDLLYVLSSQPYPLHASESMDLSHTITGGRIYLSAYNVPSEAINATHTITGGALRVAQQTIGGVADDSMDMTHTISGGLLRTMLQTTTPQAEALDATHTISSGQLRVMLIRYQWVPQESIDMTHTITGGVLS